MSDKWYLNKRLWAQIGLAILMALVIWLPRGFKLDQFVTTDEVAWLPRSANFYYALAHRDLAATRMNEAPGVTLMWAEMIAYLLVFPQYRGFGQGMLDKYKFYENLLLSNGVQPLQILVTSRVLMVLLYTLVLGVTFFIAMQVFKTLPTIVGFLLIAFNPYHNAITRLAHLDGPMGTFFFLSMVAFLAYLLVKRNMWYLAISAVAGALALLSKITAWIGVPAIILLTLVDYFVWQRHDTSHAGQQPAGMFKSLVRPLISWGVIFLLALTIFYPAMWVQPFESMKALVLSPLNFAARVVEAPPGGLNAGGDSAEISFVFGDQPLAYLLRYVNEYYRLTTPLALAGLLLAFLAYLFKVEVLGEKTIRRAVVGLLLFVALYTIVMTIPPKSSPKYYIPVYPALDMIAGLGWVAGTAWFVRRSGVKRKELVMGVLLGGVVLLQAASALRTFPYYFTYYNPMTSGVKIFGSGEGLDQAAAYLNQKPDAESLKVLSWYGIGPFSYFFQGISDTIPVGAERWSVEDIQNLHELDYLVTYQNQWMRGIPAGLFDYLAGVTPEYIVTLNGAEYAMIYSVDQILRYHEQK